LNGESTGPGIAGISAPSEPRYRASRTGSREPQVVEEAPKNPWRARGADTSDADSFDDKMVRAHVGRPFLH
jgi:hypothetical protein